MRSFRVLTLLVAIGLAGKTIWAQDKVAEGTYEFHGISSSGAPIASPGSHWILYSRPSGGYRLESEIGGRPQGRRFLQIEELDERLIPMSVAYKVFVEHQKEPAAEFQCKVTAGITCSIRVGEEGASTNTQPYHYEGPFFILLDDYAPIDLVWLLAGAINMARAERRETNIAAIVVSDSNKPHELAFKVDSKEPLTFIGSETMEFNGKNIAVRHYTYGSGKDVWVSESGILIKETYGSDEDLFVMESGVLTKRSMQGKDHNVLSGYRQYKKLIPELSIEASGSTSPH